MAVRVECILRPIPTQNGQRGVRIGVPEKIKKNTIIK